MFYQLALKLGVDSRIIQETATGYTYRIAAYDRFGNPGLSSEEIVAMVVTDSGATAFGEEWTLAKA